jgi:hypothetical protein
MARYVRISTIGAEPPRFGISGKQFGTDAVNRMIRHWRGRFDQVLPEKPDLILVPEACDRFPGHSMKERLEYYRGSREGLLEFFRETAKANGCYIGYSAIRALEDGTWRNSTRIIDRGGETAGIYNKNHLVIEETTQGNILCGKDAPVISCDFGRVACAICFDLNFDELRLKYKARKPDLILFSSMYHGGLMQAYWAYSCRAHFVSAIAGEESGIISPVGTWLARTTNYFDFVTHTVNLDCAVAHLDYNWGKLRAMNQKYGPGVRIYDPGYLGSVLISSEMEDKTAGELVAEFEIELLDEYMARALAHHHDPANSGK